MTPSDLVSTAGPLSARQVSGFERDGFLVIDAGVEESVLDGIVADVAPLYPVGPNPDGVQPPTRVQDAWRFSRNVHALAVAPGVLTCLRQLYGREPRPFQTLNFPVGTMQPAHSDALHFNSQPESFMCGVWVALEDCDEDNGPVEYWVGSHRLPLYSMADAGVTAREENYAHYEVFLQRVIEEHGFERRSALLRKGQALVWAANLLHGGAGRRDLHRTRHSQVTHCYFEGCRYTTPMTSTPERVAYRDPHFLPRTVASNPIRRWWQTRLGWRRKLAGRTG
jgi:ectoine hydroxylase-related dioxygenase (phytanoyl-CoA dioxygenase family)